MLIARALGADGYGLVNLSRSLFMTVAMVAPLGLDAAILKYVGQRDPRDHLIRATIVRLRLIALSVSLIVVALGGLAASFSVFARVFQHPGFDHLVVIALLALPAAADLGILGALYKARSEAGRFAVVTYYVQSAVRVVMVVAALALWPTVTAIIWINALQVVVTALCLALDDGRRRGDARPGAAPSAAVWTQAGIVLRESLWMCLSILVYGTMRLADLLFLGAYADAKSIGEYAALSTVAQLIAFYAVASSLSLGPRVAALHAAGDRAGLRAELRGYVSRASVVSGFLFGGIAAFGSRLDLVFGSSFQFDPVVALLLPLSVMLSATLAPIGFALSMTGRHREENLILACGAALLVGACALLVPRYGQVGAAAAVTGAFLVVNGVRFAYVARVHGFAPGLVRDLVPPIAALIFAYAARAVGDWLGARDLLTTFMACLLFSALYGAVFAPGMLRRPASPGVQAA